MNEDKVLISIDEYRDLVCEHMKLEQIMYVYENFDSYDAYKFYKVILDVVSFEEKQKLKKKYEEAMKVKNNE